MKNEVIGKVNKIGRIGQILVKVGTVISVLALVVCVIGCIAFWAMPQEAFSITQTHNADINVGSMNSTLSATMIMINEDESMEGSLELDGIPYEITDMRQEEGGLTVKAQSGTYTFSLHNMAWTMLLLAVYIISGLAALRFTGSLCKKFRYCETPFTEEIVENLQKLAWSLVPLAVFSSVSESVIDGLFTGNMDIMLGIDMVVVVLIILIFLLSAIFKYGTMLQQESDETL